MNWQQKQIVLSRLGITGFTSEEHFEEWLKWELDDRIIEKRILNAFNKINHGFS